MKDHYKIDSNIESILFIYISSEFYQKTSLAICHLPTVGIALMRLHHSAPFPGLSGRVLFRFLFHKE